MYNVEIHLYDSNLMIMTCNSIVQMLDSLCMPHFIVCHLLPGCRFESIIRICPFVGEPSGHVPPFVRVQRLVDRLNFEADSKWPELIRRLPRRVSFLHTNTCKYRIPMDEKKMNRIYTTKMNKVVCNDFQLNILNTT